jgi:hypothetical protein
MGRKVVFDGELAQDTLEAVSVPLRGGEYNLRLGFSNACHASNGGAR